MEITKEILTAELESLRVKLEEFVGQANVAKGAILACEGMIKKLEEVPKEGPVKLEKPDGGKT